MNYLLKRFKEASTWASLSAASAALASVPVFAPHALTASAVFLTGCASQPAFCPELTLKFCPAR